MLYSVISAQIVLCMFLLGIHFQNSDGASLDDYIYLNRYRRQTTKGGCSVQSFQCDSGDCIPEENLCDGTVECTDGSDEKDDCHTKIMCNAPFLFKCNYGACIDKIKKCNGVRDCRDNSDETLPECRNRTQTPVGNLCGITKFKCDSGECIDDSKLCDGIENCNDKSDETAKTCSKLNCPASTYRCAYGACVERGARCDGTINCLDGSDENFCPTRGPIITPKPPTPTPVTPTVSPPITSGCILPNNPPHGKYTILNPLATYKPGDIVPLYTILSTNCTRGYKAHPPTEDNNTSYCFSGLWTPPPKTCTRTCKSIIPKKGTTVKCKLNGIFLTSCMDPIDNTIAQISCESALYEEQGLQQNPTRLCKDGSWDYPITSCQPVCGQKRSKGVTNVVGGSDATKGDYPWQIGVFNAKQENICGGSIINPNIVLSAAHCFTDYTGAKLPAENYFIGAGKYYRSYSDERDINAQYSDVKSIHVPERYKGLTNFHADDIAIIILLTSFQLSPNVQPVCIDLQTSYDQPYFSTNGIVTGWGYVNELQEPSEVLKELSVPFIPYERCFEEVPTAFRKFITYDKICAGFLDNATSVCQGDSGGALVFPKINGFTERYYVRGVVSTSPANEIHTCDSNQYGTYTSIAKHIDFISDLVTLHRVTN